MAQTSQLLKGILEGCILALLYSGEDYGYMIVERLNKQGFTTINEATVYPILTRLEKKKILAVEIKPSKLGPPRKYYSLTKQGELELENFVQSWSEMNFAVKNILDKEDLL